MLGRLLAEWGETPAGCRGETPAGCLFLLPLWHPVLVAEQIGTLAAIAKGRFIMQCGLGYGEARFAAMGRLFEEALDIVRRLLAGETVSSSRRFHVAEASLALRPAEPVEVWIGASAPPAIDRAARLAEGWIASPGLTPAEARSQPTFIASAAPLTVRRRAPSPCGATFTSASRRPRHKRCCGKR